MDNILVAVTVVSAVILGVTGAVKTIVNDNKYLPFINVVIGIGIGLIYAVTIVNGDVAVYAWAGAIAGLSAGGFYDFGANTKAIVNQSKSNALINDGNGEKDNNREDGE